MATWIVSAGSYGREYADQYFRFGMAFVGGDQQRARMARVRAGLKGPIYGVLGDHDTICIVPGLEAM